MIDTDRKSYTNTHIRRDSAHRKIDRLSAEHHVPFLRLDLVSRPAEGPAGNYFYVTLTSDWLDTLWSPRLDAEAIRREWWSQLYKDRLTAAGTEIDLEELDAQIGQLELAMTASAAEENLDKLEQLKALIAKARGLGQGLLATPKCIDFIEAAIRGKGFSRRLFNAEPLKGVSVFSGKGMDN